VSAESSKNTLLPLQTLQQVMGAKFTSEVSEKQEGNEKDGGRLWWEKWTFSDIFSALVIDSMRKYLRNFDVIDFAITAHSITENKVYRFWQKTKKQQPSLMGIWNKWTGLYFKPFGTKWHMLLHIRWEFPYDAAYVQSIMAILVQPCWGLFLPWITLVLMVLFKIWNPVI
jgi:hypothetical protein